MTILALESTPGGGVIPFVVESNWDALFHILVKVTSGMETIPESSTLTDKTASDVDILVKLSDLSKPVSCVAALLGSLALSNIDTTSRHCSADILTHDGVGTP